MAIVCGTDFSKSGDAAVRAATALATRLSEPLWIVHVIDSGIKRLDSDAEDRLVSAAGRRLREQSRRLRSSARRSVRTRVLIGRPHEAMLSFPEVREPSLVVVSSQGHGESPLYRLGGTSERIAANASVPVLVVRDAEPFESWARRARPLRVVLGLDFTASGDAAIRWTKTLRKAAPLDLTIAHVYYADEAQRRYGVQGTYSPLSTNPEVERMLVRDLADRVGKVPGAGKLQFRAVRGMGRLADHLLDLAEREGADLVVVGTHHRRGAARLASVSSGVLHLGRMAVAVVPIPEGSTRRADALPTVQRVLITTDFSAISNQAVPYGYGLLAGKGGEVHLLHVVEPGRGGKRAEPDAVITARLRALVPEAAARLDVVTRTEVAHGPVARTIVEAAERLGVDLVCMASHGRAGLAGAMFGSTARAVLHESRRPVLVVRPPSP